MFSRVQNTFYITLSCHRLACSKTILEKLFWCRGSSETACSMAQQPCSSPVILLLRLMGKKNGIVILSHYSVNISPNPDRFIKLLRNSSCERSGS